MKYYFLLFFIFYTVGGIAQDTSSLSAHITYAVVDIMTEEERKEAIEIMREKAGNSGVELFIDVQKVIVQLKYDLFIYQNQSKYSVFEMVPPEDYDRYMAYTMAIVHSGGNKTFFYDAGTKKLVTQSERESQLYNVANVQYNWVITNEKKQIQSYTCYKAVAYDSTGMDNTIIEYYAWFTPEIPFPFGPLKAVGLPGLVLESKIDKITILRAEKIEISSSAASAGDVAMKPGGIEITEEERNDMISKFVEAIGKD